MQPRDIDFDENESQQDCARVATNRRESESGEGVIASGAGTPREGEGGVPELRDVRDVSRGSPMGASIVWRCSSSVARWARGGRVPRSRARSIRRLCVGRLLR